MDNNNQIVVYQTADNQTQIEVHMENETVWLTQAQMAELFQKDRTVISRHIRNVFNEGELEEQSTCAKFAHMGHDGLQQYETVMYNLDVIISVGYRVKSQRGTAFRIWATKVLKEYMLRGYAINQRLLNMEERMNKRIGSIENTLAEHQEKSTSSSAQAYLHTKASSTMGKSSMPTPSSTTVYAKPPPASSSSTTTSTIVSSPYYPNEQTK